MPRARRRGARRRGARRAGTRGGSVIAPMVEPVADVEPPMPLTLASPIIEIDAKIASRKGRARSKGATVKEAWEVLSDAFDVVTVGDLVHHYPRRYIDRSHVQTIRGMKIGQYVTVIARVTKVFKRLTRRKQTMVTVTLADGSGFLDLTFFNQPWTANLVPRGDGGGGLRRGLAVPGTAPAREPGGRGARRAMSRPRAHRPDHAGPSGVARASRTRTIRELIYRAFERLAPFADPLPPDDRATPSISAPTTGRCATSTSLRTTRRSNAATRAAEVRRAVHARAGRGVPQASRRSRPARRGARAERRADRPTLRDTIPFEPTDAQRRAIGEIERGDGARPRPMNVLLQGDVGAGKTSWRCTRAWSPSARATRPRSWPPPRSWPASTTARSAALLRGRRRGAVPRARGRDAAGTHRQGKVRSWTPRNPSRADEASRRGARRVRGAPDRGRDREGPERGSSRGSPRGTSTS